MSKKVKGLGNIVKNVTESLGIEQCEGCVERQEILNNLIPFGNDDNEISIESRAVLFRLKDIEVKSATDRMYLFSIYNRVFNTKLKSCQCQDQMQEMIKKLLENNVE